MINQQCRSHCWIVLSDWVELTTADAIDLLSDGAFELFKKNDSAELPYNSVFYTKNSDGTYKYEITAPKTYKDKQFMYWAIYSDPGCNNLVIKAYNIDGGFSWIIFFEKFKSTISICPWSRNTVIVTENIKVDCSVWLSWINNSWCYWLTIWWCFWTFQKKWFSWITL